MASSLLRPTMRRLLLLLAAATSLNCQVKTSGLAELFDDAAATGAGGAPAASLDGAVAATGGQGGGQGGVATPDAWPAIDGQGSAGRDGSPTTVVASGGAPALDGARPSTGGSGGAGGMGGGTTSSTGGRLGPSGLGGLPSAPLDGGPSLGDATTATSDGPTTADSPMVQNPDLGPDSELLPDLGRDQPATPADAADLRRSDTAPEAPGDNEPPLLWHDEFEGAANTAPDGAKWDYVTWGPSGGVNNEKQQYTSSLQNVFLDGEGHLVIRALRSASPNAQAAQYTSGRINTKGSFSFKTGRLEVRAKLPAGVGSFPGIITMGTQGAWPQCGELGLVEQYGQDKSWFYAGAYADTAPESGNKRNVRYEFPDDTTASSEFHVYSVDWYSDRLVFQVDGDEIMQTSYGTSSPFYTTFQYIVLDVAVGGTMGGAIDPDGFPMDMVVDYVRVYSL